MDIFAVLEAVNSPLTINELQELCGTMFSQDRLDNLLRSGDVQKVSNLEGVYWCTPPALRKKPAYQKNVGQPKEVDRAQLIRDITSCQNKLITISQDYNALLLQKDYFPTEEQDKLHRTRLHNYNAAKEVGTFLVEKIAEMETSQVKSIYERYDLNDFD